VGKNFSAPAIFDVFSIAADSKTFCSGRAELGKTLLRCFRAGGFALLCNRSHRRRSAWAVELFYFLEFWKTNLAPALSRGLCFGQFLRRGFV